VCVWLPEHQEDWRTLRVGTALKVKAMATPTRKNKWRATTIILLGLVSAVACFSSRSSCLLLRHVTRHNHPPPRSSYYYIRVRILLLYI
jgi:hypothetical protein